MGGSAGNLVVTPPRYKAFTSPAASLLVKRVGFFLGILILLAVFLLPLAYGVVTSLKTDFQLTAVSAPVLPSSLEQFENGGQSYDVYSVPMPDGTMKRLALVEKGRESSKFMDPTRPDAGLIEWKGAWRALSAAWRIAFQWVNFLSAWKTIDFLRLLLNTIMYASISTVGALCSASLVAYGFSRFNFPFKGAAFLVLMATIVLPPSVTLIPTYSFYFSIHWVGTWLPIIIPTFFANAYNVFLLRQFMMGIPRELDEAAKIDGAGPLRTFFSIIIPQAVPALIVVALFHFFFCWNDFFGPLIYLAGQPGRFPISVGLTKFFNMYIRQNSLVQAAALISTAIPVCIFIFAQKYLMQGIVVTGVEK
jgi:multiple sugar transport system permease protein